MLDLQDSKLKDDEAQNNSDNLSRQQKKKYSVIPIEIREKFIRRVTSHEVTIREAAKEFGIKFSTSKAILQIFKREGRIGKKKSRQRKPGKLKKMIQTSNLNQQPQNMGPILVNKTGNQIQKNKIKPNQLTNPQQVQQYQQYQIQNIKLENDKFNMETNQQINDIQNNQLIHQMQFQSRFQMIPDQFYNNSIQYPQNMYIPQMQYQPQPVRGNTMFYYPPQQPQFPMSPMYQNFPQYQEPGNQYNNPFVSQPQNHQIVKEELNEGQTIKQQIENLNTETIKFKAMQFQILSENHNRQEEFNILTYFE